MQHGTDRGTTYRNFICLLDLAGDLGFADDHAVKRGNDAEEVANRRGISMLIDVGLPLLWLDRSGRRRRRRHDNRRR